MKKSLWALALLSLLAGGCHRDMWLQPKAKVNRESDFFADGLSSRPNVPGTVATEDVGLTRPVRTGYDSNGKLVREIPMAVTKELIARGKERYQIFCTHCHGAVGDGEGMIAQRGLTLAQPVASYHTDRLRELPDGHIFDVITNGFGTMYPFSDRLPDPNDRWAIVAYIRTLQYSQFAPASSLPADMRAKVDNPPPLPSQQTPEGKHGKGEDHSAGGAH